MAGIKARRQFLAEGGCLDYERQLHTARMWTNPVCLPLSEILGCIQPKVDGENVGIDTCVSVEFMRQIKDKQANKSQYQLL